jgi:hypothetical protein
VRSLYQAFARVEDGRKLRGRQYEAALVLTLLMLDKLAREETMAGSAQWIRERQSLLGQWPWPDDNPKWYATQAPGAGAHVRRLE